MPTEPTQPPAMPGTTIPASAEALLAETSRSVGLIRLAGGTELGESDARQMAAQKPVRLIVLAGAVDCGKTTLLTCLYEMFQEGPVEKKQFAGCETLPAFEKKCHYGRSDSGNESEDTVRNTYEGPHAKYVHLKLQNGAKALGHIDFLFTDVSGEMFEHARNSTEECKKLTFLRQACHILVFLDCEKIFDPKKRWGMVKDAKSLIQSCLDSDVFESDCYVTVVWSKYDFLAAAKGKEKTTAKEFIKQVEQDFQTRFGTRIKNFKFHQTAARPNQFPEWKFGYGVAELLEEWISKVPLSRKVEMDALISASGGNKAPEKNADENAPATEEEQK